MKKIFNIFMVMVLLGTQTSVLFNNITYYASEIASDETAETSSATTSEVTSDYVSETQSEATSDVASEVSASEVVTSEVATSDVVNEVSASEVAVKSDVNSEAISENSETTSEEVASDIQAKITIDEDGFYSSQAKSARSADNATVTLNAEENQSAYVNDARLDAGSGESTINITPTSKSATTAKEIENKEVYYVLDEEGNIVSGSTKQPRSYEGNLVTVYNGTIVEADNAIARTSGGYDYSFYIYESIDDLKSNTNGTPISGGGFDATYVETIEEDGVYYDHIIISGYDGYVVSDNVQIVPEELMQARSYYTVEGGDWVYYSAIDPVTSTEYDRMAVDSAPAEAVEGTKYYTNDDVNYYTEAIIDEGTDTAVSYNSYFMNLPFRSASSYTASDYKSYLNAKGKSSSEYYNETSAFTKAQDYENVNSLMIFAMANHESAYGTSTYARACYNFFGRGAVDSDPDKACESYSYNTATDGILAQALFLENGYFDVLDWRYSGTHVGNKSSGMNVKYASDPDWGKKISNHAYMMDQYKGGKEEDKYAIVQVSGVSHVYTSGSLSTKVKSSGDSGKLDFYDLSQMAGTSNTVNVVATHQDSDAYQIYVPTSVKTSSSQDCSYTSSMRGSYPNYNGRSKVSVDTNTANYSCDYVSYTNGSKWIKKSGTKIINDKSVPNATKNIYEYYSNGDVKYKFVVDGSSNVIKYAYRYDEKGNIDRKYTYQDGTKYGNNHGSHYKTVYYVDHSKLYKAITYTSSQKVQYYYEYYSGATLSNSGDKIKYRFNIDGSGHIIDAFGYTEGPNRKRDKVYTYYSNTKYGSHANRIQYRFNIKTGTSYITKAYRYRTGSASGGYDKVYTYQSNTTYGTQSMDDYNDVFWLKGSNNVIDYAIKYKNGEKYIKYTYDSGTVYGQNHGDHIKSRYYY